MFFNIFFKFFLSFMLHKMHLKIFNLMTKTEMKNMWAFFHHLNNKKIETKPAFFFTFYIEIITARAYSIFHYKRKQTNEI